MAESLPTLKGLRAFEESFLRGSYTAAAKSLNVQQPAISYQIKRLEDDLGVELFKKQGGRLVPTPEANDLFATLSQSFDAIRHVSNKLRRSAATPSLTIATYPGIGTYWLSSRLPLLAQALSVSTKVVTLVNDSELLRENADCWILFGNGHWRGFEAEFLLKEEVSPVVAPSLMQQISESPEGWQRRDIAIIQQEDSENRWITWKDWLAQTGNAAELPNGRMEVNDHGYALHLAMAGAGITLAWLDVVEELLTSGSLMRLSEAVATTESGYWLLGRPGFFETERGKTILDVFRLQNSTEVGLAPPVTIA